MTDGLYQVTYKGICAGFIVQDGEVVACAPVLQKRLDYWKTIAIYCGDCGKGDEQSGLVDTQVGNGAGLENKAMIKDQEYLKRVFGKVGKAKPVGGGNYAPKLDLGKHRVLLKSYGAKNSKKPGMEDQTIVEAEFVVMTSPVHKEGETRGWAWFIDEPGWSGAYNQDYCKKFLKIAGQCIGDHRDTEEIGADLAGPGQKGRGLMLEAVVSHQVDRKTGKVKTGPKGDPYMEINWIAVPQSLEDVAKARAVLDEMDGVKEEAPPPPPPPPAATTSGLGGLLKGRLGQ